MTRLGFLVAAMACLSLAACENAKESLGLDREAPDEFAIVKRAPLEMPPGYDLRPPQPGAPRPQEATPEQQARQTVFGAQPSAAAAGTPSPSAASTGEAILLQKTGAVNVDPSIRRTLDQETKQLQAEQKPTVDRILSVTGKAYNPPAQVVDAPAEAQRIKQNQTEGKPVTEGETPTVTKK